MLAIAIEQPTSPLDVRRRRRDDRRLIVCDAVNRSLVPSFAHSIDDDGVSHLSLSLSL